MTNILKVKESVGSKQSGKQAAAFVITIHGNSFITHNDHDDHNKTVFITIRSMALIMLMGEGERECGLVVKADCSHPHPGSPGMIPSIGRTQC